MASGGGVLLISRSGSLISDPAKKIFENYAGCWCSFTRWPIHVNIKMKLGEEEVWGVNFLLMACLLAIVWYGWKLEKLTMNKQKLSVRNHDVRWRQAGICKEPLASFIVIYPSIETCEAGYWSVREHLLGSSRSAFARSQDDLDLVVNNRKLSMELNYTDARR